MSTTRFCHLPLLWLAVRDSHSKERNALVVTHTQMAALVLTLTLGGHALAGAAQGTTPDQPADLITLIKLNNGVFSPQIRAAFLRHSEELVIKELAGVKITLSGDQLALIRNDPNLSDACYGTVYPPDPRILLNILELRKELGEPFFHEYRNLIVAGSVARRFVGVGAETFGEKEEWALRSRIEAQNKTGRRQWPEYTVVNIVQPAGDPNSGEKNKKTPKSRIVKKRQAKWDHHESKMTDAEGLDIVGDFLKEKKITPSQLLESGSLKKELLTRMGDKAPTSDQINYEMLYKVMIREGLRPAERDPFPCMAEFCKYLDSIKPRFPVKTAPWPILMPLAKGWPLREARDIWSRVEKGGKLPTYGNYQKKELVIQKRLEPFPWHWQSWQGTYQAGGVCHEMSTIGLGTYMSVGVPTTKAGQPHHSCILVFSHSENGYFVGTKQGTHGPLGTHSQWLFADPRVETLEPYHMGLALSMNVGLKAYMDSRIGVYLAEMLVQRKESVLADKLLQSVARINPYNTEVWDALRELRPQGQHAVLRKAELIRLVSTLVSSSAVYVLAYKEKPVDVSLENEEDEDYSGANPKKWASTYAHTIGKMMLLPGLEPVADRETNRKTLALLRASLGGSIPVSDPIAAFTAKVDGWESLKEPVIKAARQYVEHGGKDLAEDTGDKIKAAATYANNDAALLLWLKELEQVCSKRMISRSGARGRKIYGDPLYRVVSETLVNQLTKMGKKTEAAQLATKLEAKLNEVKGKGGK